MGHVSFYGNSRKKKRPRVCNANKKKTTDDIWMDEIPGPSHVQEEVPGPSQVQEEVPGPSQVQEEVPGPSQVQEEVPGPSQVQEEVPGPSQVQEEVPGPSQVQEEVPGPSQVQEEVTGPSQVQEEVPGLSQVQEEIHEQLHHNFLPLLNKSEQKLNNSMALLESPTKKILPERERILRRTYRPKERKLTGNSIMDVSLLSEAISNSAVCGKCRKKKSKLTLQECVESRRGLSQRFLLICNICSAKTYFSTSNTLAQKPSNQDKRYNDKTYDVNFKSVHASSHCMGQSGLEKCCGILNLPKPVNNNPYGVILKKLHKKSGEMSENMMKEAAQRLFFYIENNSPENIMLCNEKYVAKVAVTVDGTWQKRGFSLKIGVVFIISVELGRF